MNSNIMGAYLEVIIDCGSLKTLDATVNTSIYSQFMTEQNPLIFVVVPSWLTLRLINGNCSINMNGKMIWKSIHLNIIDFADVICSFNTSTIVYRALQHIVVMPVYIIMLFPLN